MNFDKDITWVILLFAMWAAIFIVAFIDVQIKSRKERRKGEQSKNG